MLCSVSRCRDYEQHQLRELTCSISNSTLLITQRLVQSTELPRASQLSLTLHSALCDCMLLYRLAAAAAAAAAAAE